MLSAVYESAREAGDSKMLAARKAWCTVERHWYRRGGKWAKRKRPLAAEGPKPCPAKSSKRRSNPGKPKLAELGILSEHGRVHELMIADEKIPFRVARPILFWSPRQRALVFVDGIKVPRPRKGNPPRADSAAATYERFHGKNATSYRDDVPIPAVRLRLAGRAVSIAYRGPRWNNKVAEHPFGQRVQAYVGVQERERVFVIAGGSLRMTARGIEG